MWINTALNQSQSIEQPHVAKVTDVQNGKINTISHMQAINVPVVSCLGVQTLPQVGDSVVLLPCIDGSYYCIGTPVSSISDGELKIASASGAYIVLNQDGSISLNGLIISKEGKIIGNPNS